MTLTDLCGELNNYFEVLRIYGEFEISNNSIDLSNYNVHEGQYIRIIGSTFNDGVHPYPVYGLKDEKFRGAVWAMAVPSSVIAQITEINQWEATNQSTLNSPYQSESFGGYSYTLKTENAEGGLNWQTHFRRKLDRWRRIRAY